MAVNCNGFSKPKLKLQFYVRTDGNQNCSSLEREVQFCIWFFFHYVLFILSYNLTKAMLIQRCQCYSCHNGMTLLQLAFTSRLPPLLLCLLTASLDPETEIVEL